VVFRTRFTSILTICFVVVALVASFHLRPLTDARASSTPDFTISASPTSRTIERGGTAVYAIHVGAVNGFTGTVTLTDTDPFPKTVPFFTDLAGNDIFPPVTVNGSGDLLFKVFSNGHQTPIGTVTLTVTGTSGSLQHSVQVSLSVIPVPDFVLFSTPFTQTVKPGGSAVYQLQVKPFPNFPNPVGLSISGLPANASASITPGTVNVPGNAELDIRTSAQTPTGSFSLTLAGTSTTVTPTGTTATITRTLALTLEVLPPNSDFSISVSPTSQTISRSQGVNAVYPVHVTAKNGFIGTVVFTATGAPGNTLAFFNPDSVTTSGDVDFLYDAAASPLGTFTLTIIATSGPLQHTIQVTCQVVA
jgi:hypothetical protein